MGIATSIGFYNYDKQRICDLYDSQVPLAGQAYNITWSKNYDGINELSFTIPYKVEGEKNHRWKYLRSEYLIKMTRGDKVEWFISDKPTRSKSGKSIVGNVKCKGFPAILKTKNIYLTFDDENGIGRVDYIMRQILEGTGWTLGYCDTLYEKDGVTEKIRSLKSEGKDGALGLIIETCNLFNCIPVYDSDNMTVNIYSMKNRTGVVELVAGRNADSVSVNEDSDDIITRLYVEGEYTDDGYIGIDDVSNDGLNYLIDFDYYREIGLFTATHEAALNAYLPAIAAKKQEISENQKELTGYEQTANDMIGQCILSLYYTSSGFATPVYTYGSPTPAQQKLSVGDKVLVLHHDTAVTFFRYETITTTPDALIQSGDYGIVKFATPAAGSIGAKEVQIETKDKQVANLRQKIATTTSEDKIAEYTAEIAQLNAEILAIYSQSGTTSNDIRKTLASNYVPPDYYGNPDLTCRKIIPGDDFIRAGYTEFSSEDYGTLYTHDFSAGHDGAYEYDFYYQDKVIISATPVKPDGTVLSRQELRNYLSGVISEATTNNTTILYEDTEKLVLRVDPVKAGETVDYAFERAGKWGYALHELQAAWDILRAKYAFFGETETLDPSGYFDDINGMYVECLYDMMEELMNPDGVLAHINTLVDEQNELLEDQDEIEATFIAAMGNMLRDGAWNNKNYVPGQEEALYQDAVEISEKMAYPKVTYSVNYVRAPEGNDIPIDDLNINQIARLVDEDLDVHDNLFVKTINIGIDHENEGSLEISNEDLTLSTSDLGTLLTRMSQLSDLINQKNELYERAKAISAGGTLFANRLNGQISILTNQLLSTVSNWHTDEQGNIIFESADGSSAMMLCGAGFMIANSHNDDNSWNWRTFGTGA